MSITASQSSAISGGVNEASGLLQDDDPTDKGSVGKAALSGAAKGAAAGMAFGPWGAAIGAAVGTGIGTLKGVKAKKEGLAANEEMARQKEITDSIAANNASMQQANTGNDISQKAIEDESMINKTAQTLSSPATMKTLNAVTSSYSPLKMKYSEAKQAGLMMKISGASTLPEKKY